MPSTKASQLAVLVFASTATSVTVSLDATACLPSADSVDTGAVASASPEQQATSWRWSGHQPSETVSRELSIDSLYEELQHADSEESYARLLSKLRELQAVEAQQYRESLFSSLRFEPSSLREIKSELGALTTQSASPPPRDPAAG
jgi:hypothetical protein